MLKGLTALTLLAGIVLVILGVVRSATILAIVGDVLVVAGVLLYLYTRRASGPPFQPTR